MPKKKRNHCYYIPDEFCDMVDQEGRWKYDPEDEFPFEKYYPESEWDELPKGHFEISANFESGGWDVVGDIDLFMDWCGETGRPVEYIYDEIPERECCISCGDEEVELIDELCDRCREEDDEDEDEEE